MDPLSPSGGRYPLHFSFKLKNKSLEVHNFQRKRIKAETLGPWAPLGALGAPPEIGSRIFAGSLNTHCLEGILEEARGQYLPSQLCSGESQKELVKNPRVVLVRGSNVALLPQ